MKIGLQLEAVSFIESHLPLFSCDFFLTSVLKIPSSEDSLHYILGAEVIL